MGSGDPFEPPARFDEYEIVRPLGQGAMGVVFLANDTLLDRPVAIKFVKRYRDVVARERFLIEARAAARLDHPNVVSVYRVGELGERPYIVSEFVRGQSLATLSKPQPWRTVLEIGRDLASGLAAAHRAGVLHRDIKPANALRLDDGKVILVDFGLAKIETEEAPATVPRPAPLEVDELIGDETLEGTHDTADWGSSEADPRGLTRDGAVLGTPRYMAPEVRRGLSASASADIFSLCSVLYELTCGQAYAPGKTDRDLTTLVHDVERGFASIVSRGLSSDPGERFASADKLFTALSALDSGRLRDDVDAAENPYRGLLSFDVDHAGVFYGRDAEVRLVIERLKSSSVVFVAGDSGVGKSSLCRAGVLARARRGVFADGRRWRTREVVCGREPFEALVSALGTEHTEIDDIVREVREQLGHSDGLLLYIDQLEELATLASIGEAQHAARLIGALAEPNPSIKIVASVRGDYLSRVGNIEPLDQLIGRGLYLLGPMGEESLRECIVGPARAAGAYFDDDTVDTLVASVGADGAALPLLQFTLRRLWELRDPDTGELSRKHLDDIGGLAGALAQHSEELYRGMTAKGRDATKAILTALVTPTRTRDRLERTALPGSAEERDAALDILVDGRILVASDTGESVSFAVAHESLISAWPRLRGWLDEKEVSRIAADRVRQAAETWRRLGARSEELLRGEQLREARTIAQRDIGEDGRALIAASIRARRQRFGLGALLALVFIASVAAVWLITRQRSQATLERELARKLEVADRAIEEAQSLAATARQRRATAFEAFDAASQEAEKKWRDALAASSEALRAHANATPPLEAALSLASSRDSLRRRLAALLYERAVVSEEFGDRTGIEELLSRMALYDSNGEFAGRWTEPASVSLDVTPPIAKVTIARYADESSRSLGPAKLATSSLSIPPGSYRLRATAPGFVDTTLPFVVKRGETKNLSLTMPANGAIPENFIFVPAGEFQYGTDEGEALRAFYVTSPIHKRTTKAFAIARTETTVGEWIEFLETLSEEEREFRRPKVEAVGGRGSVELVREGGSWVYVYKLSQASYRVPASEPIRYTERTVRAEQRWQNFPVTGISPDDIGAYLKWLAATGKVPTARLCVEDEWERAAKGADARRFSHGDVLTPANANYDETYGRKVGGYGLDEVGSYPSMTSPFGLLDAVGNAFEVTKPIDDLPVVVRGGAFYFGAPTAAAANRGIVPLDSRDVTLGFRVCADVML